MIENLSCTVIVPTYNRSGFLGNTLDHRITAVEAYAIPNPGRDLTVLAAGQFSAP